MRLNKSKIRRILKHIRDGDNALSEREHLGMNHNFGEFADVAVLERRRDKTRAVKKRIMQQLLTGRVRLVDPDFRWYEDSMIRLRKWVFIKAHVMLKHRFSEVF